MEQGKTITLKNLIAIGKRRRWTLIVLPPLIFLVSLVVVWMWEPVYRSTSTILIEEQEIPREYVMATVTSYAAQRLQSINQRIMSASRLTEVITRFNLYEDERKRFSTDEIINKMRTKDIKFETINADVTDRRGVARDATIAFSLSYEGKNPQVVQQVATVLASLYLEENLKVVEQQTTSTTKFLEDEMKTVQRQLYELDNRIADLKVKNARSLPELLQYNLQTLDTTDRTVEQLNDQLRTLREKESGLQGQLAAIEPDELGKPSQDKPSQERTLLAELQARLLSLKSRYSEAYPDVKKTKAEIAALEKKLSSPKDQPEAPANPGNPTQVMLAAQLSGIRVEIESIQRQIEAAGKKRDDYRKRLEGVPKVEEGYTQLMNERNNTQLKYDDLMKKLMESRVAHGLEKEQMGERFTLIDPARLPEKPVRPNRQAILFMGLVLGIGAGVGGTFLQEAMDKSARSAEDLNRAFPFPVLAEIPEIVTIQEERRKRRRLRIVLLATAAALVIAVVAFHFFVMDLDVFWARFSRRFLSY